MKARIEELLAYLGVNAGRFADEIGIQRSAMSHILNERNKPSLDVIQKIMARYPDIEPNWLLNGLGNMTRSISDIPKVNPPVFTPQPGITEEKTNETLREKTLENKEDRMPFTQHLLNFESKSTKNEEIKLPPVFHTSEKRLVKLILLYDDKSFVEYKAE